MFPSLSRISEPLLGAGQPTASSGPPRDKRSLGFRLVSGDKRRPGVIIFASNRDSGNTPPATPTRDGEELHGEADGVPRRASLLLRHHPKSLQGHAHSTRLTPSPRRAAASGLIGLQTGPRIHQRSLPGHTAHHHPGREGRDPSDPPIISRIGGEGTGRISASRSETTPSKLSPAHCSRAPAVCEGAQSRSCGFGRQHDHTPVGTPKRDSDSAMQETPYSPNSRLSRQRRHRRRGLGSVPKTSW
jgi:hypothetical protein